MGEEIGIRELDLGRELEIRGFGRGKIKQIINLISADAFVLGGGGLYSEKVFNLAIYLDLIFVLLLRKPTYILGIGVSPKRGMRHRLVWRYIVKRCRYVSVRDQVSREYLESASGQKIPVHGDLFLANQKSQRDVPKKVMGLRRTNEKLALVCLANPFHDYSGGDARAGKFLDQCVDGLSHLIDEGYHLVFLPFLRSSDQQLICEIRNRLDFVSTSQLQIFADFQLDEINQVFSVFDFCVCMRFHSAVLAVKNCVNFAAISYDHKTEGLLESVGLTDRSIRYGISDQNCFGIESDFGDSELKKHIQFCLKRKLDTEKRLGLVVPYLEREAQTIFKMLVRDLGSGEVRN